MNNHPQRLVRIRKDRIAADDFRQLAPGGVVFSSWIARRRSRRVTTPTSLSLFIHDRINMLHPLAEIRRNQRAKAP